MIVPDDCGAFAPDLCVGWPRNMTKQHLGSWINSAATQYLSACAISLDLQSLPDLGSLISYNRFHLKDVMSARSYVLLPSATGSPCASTDAFCDPGPGKCPRYHRSNVLFPSAAGGPACKQGCFLRSRPCQMPSLSSLQLPLCTCQKWPQLAYLLLTQV